MLIFDLPHYIQNSIISTCYQDKNYQRDISRSFKKNIYTYNICPFGLATFQVHSSSHMIRDKLTGKCRSRQNLILLLYDSPCPKIWIFYSLWIFGVNFDFQNHRIQILFRLPLKNLYMNVHGSIIYISPKVETTQMSID